MNALDKVAAQRDEMSMKNRELARQLEAARAEIARLKGGASPPAPAASDASPTGVVAVPATKPGKGFRTRTVR